MAYIMINSCQLNNWRFFNDILLGDLLTVHVVYAHYVISCPRCHMS